jgi:hypothetical protein
MTYLVKSRLSISRCCAPGRKGGRAISLATPVVKADQRRAVVAVAKGMSGHRTFDAALAAWDSDFLAPARPADGQISGSSSDRVAERRLARLASKQ